MKNYPKRFLASFLCLCLVLSMCSMAATAAGTDSEPETLPVGLKNITFRDCGYPDGTYTYGDNWRGYAGSLDGTILSGKVTFGNLGGAAEIWIIPQDSTTGLKLRQRNAAGCNENYLYLDIPGSGSLELKPEIAGVEKLVGAELDLKMSFQLMDNDGDGATDDLKLGVWFNKVLYNNEYFYINDCTFVKSNESSRMVFNRNNDANDFIKIVNPVPETMPEGLTNITFRDFGIADGAYAEAGGKTGVYSGSSLDGTLLSGKVTFGKVGGAAQLLITPEGTWEGALMLRQRDAGNHGSLYLDMPGTPTLELTPDIAGVQLTGAELDLQMSFQLVDNDSDGNKDDLKLGIWFSKVLYNNEYFYINDCTFVLSDKTSQIVVYPQFDGHSIVVKSTKRDVPETMPEGLTNITFRDFGIADGTYTGAGEDLGYYKGTSIDGTLFSGKITFDKVGGAGWLVITPYGTWEKALVLAQRDNENHNYLYLRRYSGGGTSPIATLTPEVAGVQLTGAELDLQMSFQLVDNDGDGNKDDLKLGIWFSGVLYNNEYFYFNDCPVVKSDAKSRIVLFRNFAADSITVESTKQETMPEGLTDITFRDFGIADGAYAEAGGKTGVYSGSSLDGTLLSGKVTFGKVGGAAQLLITPEGTWEGGLMLRQRDAGNHTSLYLDVPGTPTLELTPEKAGVTTLTGAELNLQMSFQLVDNDGDGNKDDLKLGIWFNGVLYNNEYFYINDCTFVRSDKTSQIVVYPQFDGHSIVVKSTKRDVPETMPEGLTNITFRDFDLADGTYTGAGTKTVMYSGSSLDGTLLSGKVTFDKVGGAAELWIIPQTSTTGLKLRQRDAGNHASLYLSAPGFALLELTPEKAGVPLTGAELDLQMSFQLVDNDGDGNKDDLKLGIWFNGVLYDNEYFHINDCTFVQPDMQSRLVLARNYADDSITVESTKQETMPEGLTNITFRDFGIEDGAYAEAGGKTGVYSGSSLDGTLLSGKVTFGKVGGAAQLMITPKGTWEGGLMLRQRDAGNHGSLYLSAPGFALLELTPEKAGVTTLTGAELNLQMSFQLVDNDGDGNKDDLKLGIWFDGELYNNEYFYINDCTFVQSDMQSQIVVYPQFDGHPIVVKSTKRDVPETMPEGLKNITFRDFGIADGTYTEAGGKTGVYSGSSLDGALLSGKVTFGKVGGAAQLLITPEGTWAGALMLRQRDAGNHTSLYLDMPGTPTLELTPEKAGVTTLTGVELDLQLSFQMVDNDGDGNKDDLKLGIWFNGALYDNEYFYVNDCTFVLSDKTSQIVVYPQFEGHSITVESTALEAIPEDLRLITFRNFSIADGTYADTTTASGVYNRDSLDGALFSGKVTFEKVGGAAMLMIAPKGTWEGALVLCQRDTGRHDSLYLRKIIAGGGTSAIATLTPEIAGVQLTGAELDLQLSFQLVDNDGDGNKDDLKLGIWFNEVLYNNEYFYFNDCTFVQSNMQSQMVLYPQVTGSSIVAKSIVGEDVESLIDFEKFGLTKDWQNTLLNTDGKATDADRKISAVGGSRTTEENPFTGDNTELEILCAVAVIALAGLLALGFTGKKIYHRN